MVLIVSESLRQKVVLPRELEVPEGHRVRGELRRSLQHLYQLGHALIKEHSQQGAGTLPRNGGTK